LQLTLSDVEAQDRNIEVGLGEIQHARELTFAFFHPEALSPTESFASKYPSVVVGTPGGSDPTPRKALVIEQVVNRQAICCVFVVVMVVSIGIGVAVGCASHNLGAGIASGAAINGLLAVLEGLVVWVSK
jgi:hypothetical protein